MTFSRLLFPESKLSTYEGKDRFAHDFPCSLDHMYRSLAFLVSQKDNLEKHLHKLISKKYIRNLVITFYDVTTYYFESVRADDLKKFGFSKDQSKLRFVAQPLHRSTTKDKKFILKINLIILLLIFRNQLK